MNYTQLVAEIQSYTENKFTTTDIDTFIEETEQRIYNTVQLPSTRKNVTGAFTAGNQYLAIPSDWLSTFSLAVVDTNGIYGTVGQYYYLLNKDVNYIREAYPLPNVKTIPYCYAIFDYTSFIVGPTPDVAYGAELHYYAYPTSIVVAGTSWLGNNFDSVLLYGSLLEAYTYMKGETDVMTMYQKRYDDAMTELKQLADAKDRQDAYRSGQVRYKVT